MVKKQLPATARAPTSKHFFVIVLENYPPQNNPQCDSEVIFAADHGSYGTKIVPVNRQFLRTAVQKTQWCSQFVAETAQIGYVATGGGQNSANKRKQPTLRNSLERMGPRGHRVKDPVKR